MSRWISQFKEHPFQANWKSIKSALGAAQVDDVTVTTSVEELARLRKVVAFVDSLLQWLDPELVPETTWQNFDSQAAACLQAINNYASSKGIAHLQVANSHADNLLTYVKPYVVQPDQSMDSLYRSVIAYSDSVDQYLEQLRVQTTGLLKMSGEAESTISAQLQVAQSNARKVEMFATSLFSAEEGLVPLAEKVTQQAAEIEKLHTQLIAGAPDSPSTSVQAAGALASVIKTDGEVSTLIANSKRQVSELQEFYVRIYGAENEDGRRTGGLASDIKTRTDELAAFEKKQKDRYEALNSQIETLLPGATSAGLASSYGTLKSSFDTQILQMSWLFYGTIVVLVVMSFFVSTKQIDLSGIVFQSFDSLDITFRHLLIHAPMFVPVVWLGYFASKRRSEAARLQQEYAHKEAIAASYQSYKMQLNELGEENVELQRELIGRAIEAIAYNASSTLDGKHGDKIPTVEAVEKFIDKFADVVGKMKTP
jgi:hypothetical protein